MYLLDTNVVSELRRVRPHGAVVEWVADVPAGQLYLSAVTIGEIQSGIERIRERDEAKASELEAWLEKVLASYSVLDMDARVFRVWARMMSHRSGITSEEAMIAATAFAHRLTVVTRNGSDFAHFGLEVVDPFGEEAQEGSGGIVRIESQQLD